MKKLLSLVLVVLFACTALVACGESETAPAELNADTIIGTWKYEVDAKEILGADIDAKFSGTVEYKKDGTCVVSMNVEDMIKGLDMDAIAAMSGVDKDTLEASMEMLGMSLNDYKDVILESAEKSLEAMGDMKDGVLTKNLYYKLEGNKIYESEDEEFQSDEAQEFTYKNGKIILEEMTLSK